LNLLLTCAFASSLSCVSCRYVVSYVVAACRAAIPRPWVGRGWLGIRAPLKFGPNGEVREMVAREEVAYGISADLGGIVASAAGIPPPGG